MRRTALIAVATAVAVVAYGRPRTREATTDIDATRPTPATIGMNRRLQTVLQDTVYFGGTTWASDSLRWEALLDSVWTFDTGVGSSINTGQNPNKPVGYHQTMEGWVGVDSAQGNGTFRRSRICAISGSYSLWAGRDSCAASPGRHSLDWDGLDQSGLAVQSGLYFLRLESLGEKPVTGRIVVLRKEGGAR